MHNRSLHLIKRILKYFSLFRISLKINDASVLLRKGNEILKGGNTKCGAETEGKAIQRLPHLGIHPICRHQTQTLLLMPRSTCWQEPGIVIPCEAVPEPDQYKCRCMQLTIRLSTRTPMEELGEGLKELKGLATPQEEQQYQPARPPPQSP